MLVHRTSNGAALAVAMALGMGLAMSPRAALAQTAYEPGSAEPYCTDYTIADDCAAEGASCAGGVCRELHGGGLACVPTYALLCCTGPEQCYRDGDGVDFDCVEVSGLLGSSGTGASLCLPPVDWCTGDDEILSLEELNENLSAEGTRVVRWAAGDFDRDGVLNGEEDRLGTDPCTAPPPRAFWNGESCVAIATGCHFGEPCLATDGVSGTCDVTDDELGTECAPNEDDLTWCGGSFPCGNDQAYVSESTAERAWCVRDECEDAPEVASLLDCIYDGENLVGYAAGDCDGDGTANDVDDTPCGTWPEDAGTPSNDAGQDPMWDAGSDGFDAGGQPIDPSFEGGGGCRCRASGAPTEIPLGPLGGLAIGLGLIIGRRRPR